MPLPQIVTPEFSTTLPSTGETIFFRPFLVKEEKMLLMAQEGQDKNEINNAVLNIINACLKTPLEVKDLPTFDIEWIFLQLRAKSVSEVIKLNLRHTADDCNHLNKIEVPIADIKLTNEVKTDNIIMIDEATGLGMSVIYPTLGHAEILTKDNRNEQVFNLIMNCVKNIFDKEQVYNDFTDEELEKFMEFFNSAPKLEHTLKYTCEKCKKVIEHKLSGLTDFFL